MVGGGGKVGPGEGEINVFCPNTAGSPPWDGQTKDKKTLFVYNSDQFRKNTFKMYFC